MPVTFVGAGSTGAAAGPSGVATAGLPAGLQDGDVLVAVVGTSRGGASGSAGFSASALWENFPTQGTNNGTTNAAISYSTRVYAAGDPTSWTFTLSATELANTAIVAYILAFRGVDHSALTWWGGNASGSLTSAGVAATDCICPTAALHPTDGGMAIAMVSALGTGGPYSVSTPAGWAAAKQDETALGPIGNSTSVFYKNYAAGTTASEAVTTTGATSNAKTGHTITLWPAKAEEVRATGARVRAASNHRAYYQTTALTCPKPVGTLTGDLMVACVAVDTAGAYSDITAPAGWTDSGIFGSLTGTGGAGYYKVYYRYAAAGEPTTYTFGKGVNQGDAVVGIVSFVNAAPPQRYNYVAVPTASGTPTLADIAGEADAQLLSVLLAGDSTNLRRSITPPAGMRENVDVRPPISGGWMVLGMWTQPTTSTANVGAKTATLLSTNGSRTAPFSGATAPYAGVSIIIPSVGKGSLFITGDGQLALTPSLAKSGGSLALAGSGGLSFGSGASVVSGALALSGSGTLALVGKLLQTGALSLSGTGTLVINPTLTGAKNSLSLSGAGTLLLVGGGGAGILSLTSSGTLAFSPVAGPRGALALGGSGSLTFIQTKATAQGVLARTGQGGLTFTSRITVKGSMARTGLGTLAFVMTGMTEELVGWDSSTQTWRPIRLRAWTAAFGWRDAKGLMWKADGSGWN